MSLTSYPGQGNLEFKESEHLLTCNMQLTNINLLLTGTLSHTKINFRLVLETIFNPF